MKYLIVFCALFTGILYAQQPVTPIRLNDSDFNDLKSLNSEKDYKIWITGENHSFLNTNYNLQLKIFKFLHETQGVNHYFFEYGEGGEYLFRRFLEDGEDEIDQLENLCFAQQFDFFKDLKSYYNDQENNGNPFTVHGIDVEHNFGMTFTALSDILKGVSYNDSIDVEMSAIRNIADYYRNFHQTYHRYNQPFSQWDYNINNYDPQAINVANSIKPIIKSYPQKRNYFKEELGDRFDQFDNIMSNLVNGDQFMEYVQNYAIQSAGFREQKIHKKLKELVNEHPEGKFYGQFGVCHLLQNQGSQGCFFESFSSLANRLKSEFVVQVIPQLYQNSQINNSLFSVDYEGLSAKEEVSKSEEKVFLIDVEICNQVKGLSDYEFLIVNYDYSDNGYYGGSSYQSDYGGGEYWGFIHFEGHYTQRFVNFSSMNSALSNFGLPEFSGPLETYGGSFCVYEPEYMYGNFGFEKWKMRTVQNDSVSISLEGFDIYAKHGYPILDHDNIQIAPYYGLGYSQARLTETHINPVSLGATNSVFDLTSPNEFQYVNPALTIDLGADLKLRYKFIGIDIKGGRLFDVSHKGWRSLQNQENSLRDGLGGFYFQVGASISFGYY